MKKRIYLIGLTCLALAALTACGETTKKEEEIRDTVTAVAPAPDVPAETPVAKEEPLVEGFSVGKDEEPEEAVEEPVEVEEAEEPAEFTLDNEKAFAAVKKAAGIKDGPVSFEDVAKITDLSLRDMGLTDISFLSDFTALTDLDISENAIADLTPLAGLSHLQALFADNNQIKSLEALRGLSKLEILCIDGNKVKDLSPVAGLKKLNGLYAADNKITDISPCLEMIALEEADLSGNKLKEKDIELLEEQNIEIIYKESE